jgi:hypothetical protein
MHREGEEVHIETDEARGGATPNIMRYVLGISLVLALAAMSVVWIVGATSRDVYPDPVPSPPANVAPKAGRD